MPLWIFPAAAVVLPMLAVSLLSQGTLRGQGNQLQAELYEGILKPLVLIVLIIGAMLLVSTPLTASIAVVAYGAVSPLAALINWCQARRQWNGIVATSLDALPVRDWRRATAAHGLVNFSQTFIGKMPVIIAGLMLPPTQAALLAVAIRVSEALQLGMTAVGLSVAPNLAALAHQRRPEELAAAMREASRISLFMALAGGTIICVFAKPLFSPVRTGVLRRVCEPAGTHRCADPQRGNRTCRLPGHDERTPVECGANLLCSGRALVAIADSGWLDRVRVLPGSRIRNRPPVAKRLAMASDTTCADRDSRQLKPEISHDSF